MRGGCYSPAVAIRSGGCCALRRASRAGSRRSSRPPAKDGRQRAGDCAGFRAFFFCVTSHSLLPQWINTLKNFRIKVWILLREEKGRMGTSFLLLLQRCRLCVCVSHELREWRRPNGDCLHQGMFAPPSYYPFCCFLLTSSQSSQLMIFCGDVRFMCSLKDAEQVFPFSAESLG